MSAEPFRFSVFGLTIESAFELPELFVAKDEAEADITIGKGIVSPPADDAPGIHAAGDSLVLSVPGVARFAIAGGKSIIVDQEPEVHLRNVRLYLLGSAFGALLHQRGLLPLHANAIEIDGMAIAFMGASGAGKSTLAAWFHDQGYRIIADDVCVVTTAAERGAWALPGLPRVRLWREALKASGRAPEDFEQSYSGDETFDKFDVAIGRDSSATEPRKLAAVYLLDVGDQFSVTGLHGVTAIDALFSNTYRGAFLSQTGTAPLHMAACCELLKSAPVFRLTRKWDLAGMGQQNALLVAHAREAIEQREAGRETGAPSRAADRR